MSVSYLIETYISSYSKLDIYNIRNISKLEAILLLFLIESDYS